MTHLLRRLRCLLRGHADHLQLDLGATDQRLVLRCVDCGRISPGWDLPRTPSESERQFGAYLAAVITTEYPTDIPSQEEIDAASHWARWHRRRGIK